MAKDLKAGEFTDMVLAAPPVALGEFRKAATNALAEATILELDKDLTRHPIDRIEKIVEGRSALEDYQGRAGRLDPIGGCKAWPMGRGCGVALRIGI